MTIETVLSSVTYAGNGEATEFAIPFPVYDAAHLSLSRIDASGEQTPLRQGADYAVTAQTDSAGLARVLSVTLCEAVPPDWQLHIRRLIPFTQENVFHNQGPYSPRVTELSLDKLTMLCQQLNDEIVAIAGEIRRLRPAAPVAGDAGDAGGDGGAGGDEGGGGVDDGEAGGGGDVRVGVPALRDLYARNEPWSSSPGAVTPPGDMRVHLNGTLYSLTDRPPLSLADESAWDVPAWAERSVRAGKDCYVYVHADDGEDEARLILSGNAGLPSGGRHTAANTRKLGGFHCLCADAGTIAGHPLSGLLAGEILPASVWDLRHLPRAEPEGMVYCDTIGKWVQIYLANKQGKSVYNDIATSAFIGDPIDGFEPGTYYWFLALFKHNRLRLPTRSEFILFSDGSNQGTRCTVMAETANEMTTGGHVDVAGRRMISNHGIEDCCGFLHQRVEDRSYVFNEIHVGGVTSGHGDTQCSVYDVFVGGRATDPHLTPGSCCTGVFNLEWSQAYWWACGRGCCDSRIC